MQDILNLQKGIEFQTNTAEATLEVGLINTGMQTVQQYANQLILNMLPLSQVVMAVDSLMSGAVQSEAEMTNLTVNFVPAQLAFFNSLPPSTQAGAGGPIVWDAEVTGFALTERAAFTTNFAGLNTGANAGTAGDAAFAAAVSTAIFGNASLTNQVLSFLQSFRNFLTNNPTELTGNGIPLSDLTKAADALTFGTEVGIALSNTGPGQVGANLEAEVANALIANAEFLNGQGPTPVGVALQLVPTATPLQGAPPPTFTLTVGTDNATTGQPFDGTGAIVPASNVTINGPLGGPFGNQNTLTSGDVIALTGNFNALNADFNNGGPTFITGETIKGVQGWTFQNFGGATVTINGGVNVGGPGTIGGIGNPGVSTINVINSNFGVQVGTPGAGIRGTPNGFTLNVSNDTGGPGHFAAVLFAASLFTGLDTFNVNIANLAGGLGVIGAPDGGAGFQNFNLTVQDSTGDTVALGTAGATNLKTITASDATGFTGGLTLNAAGAVGSGPANFANVTTVTGTGLAGNFIVSGAESGGLLSVNHALTSISGGAGNDRFDLTSLNNVDLFFNALSVSGGAGNNEVDFNGPTLTSLFAGTVISLTNEQIIGATLLASGGGTSTLNDAFLTETVAPQIRLLNADGSLGTYTLGGNLTITHAQNNLTVNFEGVNFGFPSTNNFIITDNSTTATTDVVNLGLGIVGGANSFFSFNHVTVNGFATTHVDSEGGPFVNFLGDVVGGFFIATGNPGAAEVVSITGPDGLGLGDTQGGGVVVGTNTVTVLGGPLDVTPGSIIDTQSFGAQLFLGVTNAATIDASAGGELDMFGPDSNTAGITVKGGNTTGSNILQGSLSAVTTPGTINGGTFLGTAVGNDHITGGNSFGDKIYDTGGSEVDATLNINIGFHDVYKYSMFSTDDGGTDKILAVTFTSDVVARENTLTINNFDNGPGGSHSQVQFSELSWGQAAGIHGLIEGDLAAAPLGNANTFLLGSSGVTLNAATDLVLDNIATFANAAALTGSALGVSNGGSFNFAAATVAANSYHLLIAYSTGVVDGAGLTVVNVADVDFFGNGTTNTNGMVVLAAHDVASLHLHTGTTVTGIDASNIFFHA